MQSEPSREEVERMPGATVLEFGASWCGICKAAQPMIDEARAQHGEARFLWVEDGRGRPLGRSFGVKLWPTLVFLRDGRECARVVRPTRMSELEEAYAQIL